MDGYKGLRVFLSVVSPAWLGWGIGGRWEGTVASSSVVGLWKFVAGVFPRSTTITGQRPPFDRWSNCCRSRKVLLWRLVLSLVVYLQPPSM